MPPPAFDQLPPPLPAFDDLPPPADIESEVAAKKVQQSFKSFNNQAIAAGAAPVANRADFLPTEAAGLRNYLAKYTEGDLDLASEAISPEKEASEIVNLRRAHPRYSDIARQLGPDAQTNLDAHLRALVRVNHTPPTPRESLTALQSISTDWLKAAASNQIADQLGAPITVDPSIPPEAATSFASRLINLPKGDWSHLLTSDEHALLDRLGGDHFVDYARAQLRPTLLSHRKSRLTGLPSRDPNAPPTPITTHAIYPDTPDLNLSDLEPVSSFARTLLYEGSRQATEDARVEAQRYEQSGAAGLALRRSFGDVDPNTIGGRAAIYGHIAFGPPVQQALNSVLLGVPGTVINEAEKLKEGVSTLISGSTSLVQNALQGKYDATLDPQYLDKKLQAASTTFSRQTALSDPNFGSSPAAEAEYILKSFPELPEDDKAALLNDYYGGAKAVERLTKGLFGPNLAPELGVIFGPALEDPVGLVATALGAKQLLNSFKRGGTPAAMKDPLKAKAFTDFDRHTLEGREYNPLEIQNRTALLGAITDRINAIPDPAAARAFVGRFQRALRDHDAPITPELTAQANTALDRFTAANNRLTGKQLSPEVKASLRDFAEPITQLHPIDQHFALTGNEVTFGPSGSALRAQRLQKWYDAQSRSAEALEIPRLTDRPHKQMVALQQNLMEAAAADTEATLRRSRFTDVGGNLAESLRSQITEESNWAAEHLFQEKAASKSWNSYLRGTLDEAVKIETEGGTFQRPNPLLKSKSYSVLAEALTDRNPTAIEAALRNPRLELPGRDAILSDLARFDAEAAASRQATISESLAPRSNFGGRLKQARPHLTPAEATNLGAVDPSVRNQLLLEWADSARAHFEAPVDVTVPAAPAPNTKLADSIRTKLDTIELADTPVKLTEAERDWLNSRRARLEKDPVPHNSPPAIEALRRDAERSSKIVRSKRDLLDGLEQALKDAADPTIKRIKLEPALRRNLESALADIPEALDKDYLSIHPGHSKEVLQSLDAFRQSLDDLSSQERALQNGVTRLASFESSLIPPSLVRRELEWADRLAEGQSRTRRLQAQQLEEMFHKKYSVAEAQAIFHELKDGKAITHEGAALIQNQNFQLLADELNAGLITPEKYVDMVGGNYAHNFFDRATESRIADAQSRTVSRLPAGYRALKLDPSYLKHRIPEKGNFYATAHVGNDFLTRDGFVTEAEASQWVKENVLTGSEVQIAKTWPLIEKEMHGLVTDVATSHLQLAEQMALHLHDARISQALVSIGEAKLPGAFEEGSFSDGDRLFTDKSGKTWKQWDGAHNPWLSGRYVSGEAYKWLKETKSEYGLFREAREGIADALNARGSLLDPALYRPSALVSAFLDKGIPLLARNYAKVKIALSPATIVKNWWDNTTSWAVAGVNPLNPTEWAHMAKYLWEQFRSRDSFEDAAMGRYNKLASEHDLVRFGDNPYIGSSHSSHVEGALEAHWRSTEGLTARLERAKEALSKATIEGNAAQAAEIHLGISEIEDQLAAHAKRLHRTLPQKVFDGARSLVNEIYDTITKPTSRTTAAIWRAYSTATFDTPSKPALLKFLVEQKGLSEEAAVRVVADTQQQLHRVPQSVGSLSRRLGGTMYAAFPADKLRRMRNILTTPEYRTRLFKMLGALYGWNHLALALTGSSAGQYLETEAAGRGKERNPVTDITDMLGGVKIPLGNGELVDIPTGPAGFDMLTPQSTYARSLSDWTNRSLPGAAAPITNAAIGVASKYFASDILQVLLGPAATGRDEKGQPITGMGDYLSYLGRNFFIPRGAPGTYEFDAVKRAWQGEERNLRTGKPVAFTETLLKTLAGVHPEMSSADRFHAAFIQQMLADDDKARWLSEEKIDDQLSTKIDRFARDPNGKLIRDKALEQLRTYYEANPSTYALPGGALVNEPMNPASLGAKLDDFALPKLIRGFKRAPLRVNFSALAGWLAIDPDAATRDPQLWQQVRGSLISKLFTDHGPRGIQPQDYRAIADRVNQAVASGRLRPDAVKTLRGLLGLVTISEPNK